MLCRYGEKQNKHGNFVAVVGTFATIFEGRLLPDYPVEACFYTKEELEKMDLAVLEVAKVDGKYKALQEFSHMAIRWGWRLGDSAHMPHTHEERLKIANDSLHKIRKCHYVLSAQIVGSVAKGLDGSMSDVDIVVKVKKCPGEDNCEIANFMEDYILDPIDLYCIRQKVDI